MVLGQLDGHLDFFKKLKWVSILYHKFHTDQSFKYLENETIKAQGENMNEYLIIYTLGLQGLDAQG